MEVLMFLTDLQKRSYGEGKWYERALRSLSIIQIPAEALGCLKNTVSTDLDNVDVNERDDIDDKVDTGIRQFVLSCC